MNTRRRFLNVLNYKSIDKVPNIEIGVWPQTIERWLGEGLLEGTLKKNKDNKAKYDMIFLDHKIDVFDLDHIEFAKINVKKPLPAYEKKIIKKDNRTTTYLDEFGVLRKSLDQGSVSNIRASMDQYLEFPVIDKKSFENMKKRYRNTLLRYPSDWEEKCINWKGRDNPLVLSNITEFGYYGLLRRWMGTKKACLVFYDEPKLAEEMLEFITDYAIELFSKALKDSTFDCFHIFEDMAFNTGPLISPDIVRKFMLPQYKRIIAFMKKNNIENIWIDSDGNIDKLIPIWIEAGINCVFPCEVKAGSDPIAIREKYGKDISMIGGIDKHVLSKAKKDIEYEVKKKCEYLLSEGGYIPTLDHLAPPDIPYENYLYYLKVKKECLG